MKKLLIALSATLFIFCSCGKKEQTISETDKKAFKTAINAYCKSHSYGMKIKSFESADIKGNNATAACKMEEAESLYNMSVKWTFRFKKDESGAWEVVSHEAK
jgi:ABC-type transporter MlaC component